MPPENPKRQFRDICQGKGWQSLEVQAGLKCYYERRKHPYLFINPVKTEVLSESPPIFQFYEIVDKNTTEKLREEYSYRMNIYELYRKGPNDVEQLTEGKSSARLHLNILPKPSVWYFMPEILTGIQIQGVAEPIQYAEYTYGRVLTDHTDVVNVFYKMKGVTNKLHFMNFRSVSSCAVLLQIPGVLKN